jgi:hypothetical protein
MDRKEYDRQYYQRNREAILERVNKYNHDNKEKVYAYNREYSKSKKSKNGILKVEQNVSVRFI